MHHVFVVNLSFVACRRRSVTIRLLATKARISCSTLQHHRISKHSQDMGKIRYRRGFPHTQVLFLFISFQLDCASRPLHWACTPFSVLQYSSSIWPGLSLLLARSPEDDDTTRFAGIPRPFPSDDIPLIQHQTRSILSAYCRLPWT